MRRIVLSTLASLTIAVGALLTAAVPARARAETSAMSGAVPAASVPLAAAAPAADDVAADLLSRLNAERRASGLAELALSNDARAVARLRAEDMATHAYLAHVSPAGVGPAELLADHGIDYRAMAENIARSDHPAADVAAVVHGAWVASSGHRENMLNAVYRRVGVAVAVSGDTFYVAEIFLD